jgi:hypothetical protein
MSKIMISAVEFPFNPVVSTFSIHTWWLIRLSKSVSSPQLQADWSPYLSRLKPTTSPGLSSGAPLISELGATLNLKPQDPGNDGSFD